VVLYVFSDAVHLEFGFVDFDLRVRSGNRVDLAARLLFFEDGTFSDTDGQLDLG
jgi:hypothetical protein